MPPTFTTPAKKTPRPIKPIRSRRLRKKHCRQRLFFEARPTPGFDQPDFDQPTNDETPHFTAPSFTAADEEPSEAELELLQALRSIK